MVVPYIVKVRFTFPYLICNKVPQYDFFPRAHRWLVSATSQDQAAGITSFAHFHPSDAPKQTSSLRDHVQGCHVLTNQTVIIITQSPVACRNIVSINIYKFLLSNKFENLHINDHKNVYTFFSLTILLYSHSG